MGENPVREGNTRKPGQGGVGGGSGPSAEVRLVLYLAGVSEKLAGQVGWGLGIGRRRRLRPDLRVP